MTRKRGKYPQEIKSEVYIHQVRSKNLSQQLYLEALRSATITMGVGPAGTGKSYIATYAALEALFDRSVQKIVLTRPVVEAGENLGFLPGTFEEKIAPYLLPLLDAIEAHVGVAMAKKLLEEKRIEFAPLAYLRGRTFYNSFVILDEAQNTTRDQMKMFITRLGDNCKMVIDGDPRQSDLPRPQDNGLEWAMDKLQDCDESIRIVKFYKNDIVRHPLLTKILGRLEG